LSTHAPSKVDERYDVTFGEAPPLRVTLSVTTSPGEEPPSLRVTNIQLTIRKDIEVIITRLDCNVRKDRNGVIAIEGDVIAPFHKWDEVDCRPDASPRAAFYAVTTHGEQGRKIILRPDIGSKMPRNW
jgi:hypothetical protein